MVLGDDFCGKNVRGFRKRLEEHNNRNEKSTLERECVSSLSSCFEKYKSKDTGQEREINGGAVKNKDWVETILAIQTRVRTNEGYIDLTGQVFIE